MGIVTPREVHTPDNRDQSDSDESEDEETMPKYANPDGKLI